MIEKYVQRPVHLENCSLFEFAKTINVLNSIYVRSRKENIVMIYSIINANDESKVEKFYKQQCALHIPFKISLNNFFVTLLNDEEDTWMSVFERYNLIIVNTDLVCDEHLEPENEADETLNEELNDQCNQLNAFELLSSMHNESKYEKLRTRYIDVAYDWAQNVEKTSNTCEIENFLKHYKISLRNFRRFLFSVWMKKIRQRSNHMDFIG